MVRRDGGAPSAVRSVEFAGELDTLVEERGEPDRRGTPAVTVEFAGELGTLVEERGEPER